MDDNYFNTLAQVESGGRNIGSSTSSAFGPYQFTDSTWNNLVKSHPELGLTPADKTNPQAQAQAIRAFTQDNATHLSSAGIDPTNTNLYMAHFLGSGGGASFLKAHQNDPSTPVTQAVNPAAIAANRSVFLNPDGSPKTVGQVYQRFDNKFGGGSGESSVPMPDVQASAAPTSSFQAAHDDFNDHMSTMRDKYGQPQQRLDPRLALLMSTMKQQPQQQAANYGGIQSPNYAATGGNNSTASMLQMMMNGRNQNNALALLMPRQNQDSNP